MTRDELLNFQRLVVRAAEFLTRSLGAVRRDFQGAGLEAKEAIVYQGPHFHIALARAHQGMEIFIAHPLSPAQAGTVAFVRGDQGETLHWRPDMAIVAPQILEAASRVMTEAARCYTVLQARLAQEKRFGGSGHSDEPFF